MYPVSSNATRGISVKVWHGEKDAKQADTGLVSMIQIRVTVRIKLVSLNMKL